MIVSITVQYILLNGNPESGFRVKRRTGGNINPMPRNTTTPIMTETWVSDPAPPTIFYVPDGRTYTLAFWSLTASDSVSGQRTAQIQPWYNIANDSHIGGLWSVTAKAFYVWDFGNGEGPNAILLDAFDIQAGDFIGDDFVDVAPDADGSLTKDANNGYINTSTQLVQGTPITIAACDGLTHKQFAYWLDLPVLRYSANPAAPVTVGAPDKHDIVAHIDDIVVAFAFYNELPPGRFPVPNEPNIYNPWWWIDTRWGKVPPPPGPPWLPELTAVALLRHSADAVSVELRNRVLELALKQTLIVADAIKLDME